MPAKRKASQVSDVGWSSSLVNHISDEGPKLIEGRAVPRNQAVAEQVMNEWNPSLE